MSCRRADDANTQRNRLGLASVKEYDTQTTIMDAGVSKTREGPIRSPGICLALIACLAGTGTHSLFRAQAHEPGPTEVTIREAARPPLGAGPQRVAALDHPLLPASLIGLEDELLASPMLHNPEFRAEVDRWIGRWTTSFSDWMPEYLERMTGFEAMVDSTLAARGLPWSLRYLPVIESGYSPTAVSSASAVGMWQFMAPTARDFGIEVSNLVDDRRDPFVSTAAAAEYLAELRSEFGSWFLALAAYNAGPDRIHGLLEQYVSDIEPSDAVYWALRNVLPSETADFVPNLIGAIIVASNPEAHGYDTPRHQPFVFDRVPVLGAISFETVALATGSTREEIERLNPEYLTGVTPADTPIDLRVPRGRAQTFRDFFARSPPAGP